MTSPCAANYLFDKTNIVCYSPACPTDYTYTPSHQAQDNDRCQYSGAGTPVASTTTLTFSPFSCPSGKFLSTDTGTCVNMQGA